MRAAERYTNATHLAALARHVHGQQHAACHRSFPPPATAGRQCRRHPAATGRRYHRRQRRQQKSATAANPPALPAAFATQRPHPRAKPPSGPPCPEGTPPPRTTAPDLAATAAPRPDEHRDPTLPAIRRCCARQRPPASDRHPSPPRRAVAVARHGRAPPTPARPRRPVRPLPPSPPHGRDQPIAPPRTARKRRPRPPRAAGCQPASARGKPPSVIRRSGRHPEAVRHYPPPAAAPSRDDAAQTAPATTPTATRTATPRATHPLAGGRGHATPSVRADTHRNAHHRRQCTR